MKDAGGMPYDKDLRDLLKATKKVSRPLPETVDERAQKIHDAGVSASAMPDKAGGEGRHSS
jgi:hypothetical protein